MPAHHARTTSKRPGPQTGQAEASVSVPFRYADVPRLTRFADVLDETRYVPVPDTWWIALCDVVMSTRAIEDERYRSVNIAGCRPDNGRQERPSWRRPGFRLSAVTVRPFSFRPKIATTVATVLSETATWVREAHALDLRVALIRFSAVREAGRDLRIARYAASAHVDYAMFSGGGVAYADSAMKRGLHAIRRLRLVRNRSHRPVLSVRGPYPPGMAWSCP